MSRFMALKSSLSGLGGLAFGVLFVVLGLRVGEDRAEVMDGAEPVEAQIVSTSVEKVVEHTAPDASRVSWYPQIEYRYSVDGRAYSSDAIWPAGSRSGEEAWARGFIADYSEGDRITARYQPDSPERSYLIAGRPWLTVIGTGLGAVFVLLGAGTLIKGLRGEAWS